MLRRRDGEVVTTYRFPYEGYKLSSEGLDHLLRTERNVPYVYDDATGQAISSYDQARGTPTIGLGLAIDTPEERDLFRPYLGGVRASMDWLNRQNMAKVAEFENILRKRIGATYLTPNMFDAIFSLAWNTGPYADVVKRVIAYAQAGDYDTAAHEIRNGPTTNKKTGAVEPGLVARRKREADLFLKEAPVAPVSPVIQPSTVSQVKTEPVPFYKEPLFWIYTSMSLVVVVLVGIRIRRTHQLLTEDWRKLPAPPRPKELQPLEEREEDEIYPELDISSAGF